MKSTFLSLFIKSKTMFKQNRVFPLNRSPFNSVTRFAGNPPSKNLFNLFEKLELMIRTLYEIKQLI